MDSYLEMLFPWLRKIKLPASRDQLMLLMAAINEIFLGIDIYLAHKISGTIVPREWIPIVFGPLAGILLLGALWALPRRGKTAALTVSLVSVSSIAVGLLGAYYHFVRAILPTAPAGSRISVQLLVWAPPIMGPLMFSLVGLLGISAIFTEDPLDSGRLRLFRKIYLQLPFSKTRGYFLLVSLGTLATLISAVLDHARTSFENPWLWAPVFAGLLGVITPLVLVMLPSPKRGDVLVHFLAMGLLILVGVLGAGLHILGNLTSRGEFVVERFIRGAPFLAPLLFSNMGVLGLLSLYPAAKPESSP